jgi:hypothetical protein
LKRIAYLDAIITVFDWHDGSQQQRVEIQESHGDVLGLATGSKFSKDSEAVVKEFAENIVVSNTDRRR